MDLRLTTPSNGYAIAAWNTFSFLNFLMSYFLWRARIQKRREKMPSSENYLYLSQRLAITIFFVTKTVGILIVFIMIEFALCYKKIFWIFSLVNVEYLFTALNLLLFPQINVFILLLIELNIYYLSKKHIWKMLCH